jgi:hypothetical protein
MHPYSSYDEIPDKNSIANDLVKPLHYYALRISPKPKEVGHGVYRQESYSEYLLNYLEDGHVTMRSRPAIQQFKTIVDFDQNAPVDCFPALFAWYCSWFIDKDVEVKITEPDVEGYPFKIKQEVVVNFGKQYPRDKRNLEPVWIPFYVKKESKFVKHDYTKIDKHVPLYDLVIL